MPVPAPPSRIADATAARAGLAARTVPAATIGMELRGRMFALFARYYDAVDPARFAADLAGKDTAILLEHDGALAGFTTLRSFGFDWRGERIQVLFSGDTIVARAFWGEQVLARAWLAEAGRIARARPDRRLVWFLIVKGHRTWRYLPAFARQWVPHPSGDEPAGWRDLRDAIATDLFGADFDPASSLIRFAASRGHLAPGWAEPDPREAGLAQVAWFRAANPGHAQGDELACLCELSPANMRPRARRWFNGG